MQRARASRLMIRADVSTVHLEGVEERTPELTTALAHLVTQARKRNVTRVQATLEIVPGLELHMEIFERGTRFKVPGRGLYACNLDGVLNALADVIREEHDSDPALLDVYARLLGA